MDLTNDLMDKSSYKTLDQREHIIKRANMYIGQTKLTKEEMLIYDESAKQFTRQTVEYIPALLKIIYEAIDNSYDVFVKTEGKYANQIDIVLTEKFELQIKDNGTGIPVERDEEGNYIPFNCFGKPLSGSNFDDSKRVGAGMNGLGVYALNAFSKKFAVRVVDLYGRRYEAQWEENASKLIKERVGSKNHYSRGVTVFSQIDIDQFGADHLSLKELWQNTVKLVTQRVFNISALYPKLKFTVNGKVIQIKNPKEFVSYFHKDAIVETKENYFIAVAPSETDEFQQHTYVNGLHVKNGGEHIDLIVDEVVKRLRTKLERKFKGIKPGDIKNKLFVIAFFRDFPALEFEGQVKEKLGNSRSHIKKYLGDFDFEKFATKVYKNKSIYDGITLRFKIAQELEKRKKLQKALKDTTVSPKFWEAKKEKKWLFLTEGDSAVGSIIAAIGRDQCSFFPLRGVVVNVIRNERQVAKNEELKQLAMILGIQFSETIDVLSHENIAIATDADVDGSFIAMLLLGFVYKYAPEYLKNKKVYRFKTPIVVIKDRKDRTVEFVFDYSDIKDAEKRYAGKSVEFEYRKGLGSLSKSEWKELFTKYSFEELLEPFEVVDQEDLDELLNWLHDDSAFKKEKVKQRLPYFTLDAT